MSTTEMAGAPQKASEVRAWLAAHPNPDPALLAPQPKQKAAAKVAAVRALGAIGGQAAFDVLSEYALEEENYSDAMLKELHTAWDAFDRSEFAATMFRPGPVTLRLDVTRSVEGLGAVSGLRGLAVIVKSSTDLAPLAECADLRELSVLVVNGGVDLSFLSDMPQLVSLDLSGEFRGTDLSPLGRTSLKHLRISLDGQPGDVLLKIRALERVQLSGNLQNDDAYGNPGECDPGLSDVVIELVRRGVSVAVYRFEKNWVPQLTASADAAGFFSTADTAGRVGLTNDEAEIEALTRRLFYNTFI